MTEKRERHQIVPGISRLVQANNLQLWLKFLNRQLSYFRRILDLQVRESISRTYTYPYYFFYLNFEDPFLVITDDNAFAIGAILSQGVIGMDLQISHASISLCSPETKYLIMERELLAILLAVKHFDP